MAGNQRKQIVMSAAEVTAFLERSRTATVASVGPDGRPHLAAMWYALIGDAVYYRDEGQIAESSEPAPRPAHGVHGRGGHQL